MKQSEMRQVAAQAARSELRRRESELTLNNAEITLDELSRAEPDLIASIWWRGASDNQIKLFRREWRQWAQGFACQYCEAVNGCNCTTMTYTITGPAWFFGFQRGIRRKTRYKRVVRHIKIHDVFLNSCVVSVRYGEATINGNVVQVFSTDGENWRVSITEDGKLILHLSGLTKRDKKALERQGYYS